MGIIWTIIIGFVAGVIAKFIMPGDNEPSGFILTTILGIVGAFVATYLGQALGWYRPGEGAGLARFPDERVSAQVFSVGARRIVTQTGRGRTVRKEPPWCFNPKKPAARRRCPPTRPAAVGRSASPRWPA
jgi:uncharacterized membrane protein YeaQ/YmgE (transglycosylase-associated protein family)